MTEWCQLLEQVKNRIREFLPVSALNLDRHAVTQVLVESRKYGVLPSADEPHFVAFPGPFPMQETVPTSHAKHSYFAVAITGVQSSVQVGGGKSTH